MKTLNQINKIMAMLCICPAEDSNRWIKFRNISFSLFSFLIQISMLIVSFCFILKHFSNDLVGSTLAFLQLSAVAQSVHTFVVAYILREKINGIFKDFQKFYDCSKIATQLHYDGFKFRFCFCYRQAQRSIEIYGKSESSRRMGCYHVYQTFSGSLSNKFVDHLYRKHDP